MSKRTLIWTVALAALPAAVAAQQPREKSAAELAPPPLPMEKVSFPAYTQGRLANGAQTLIVPHREQPVVTVSLYIQGAGGTSESADKAGIASMTASLLDNGTQSRTSREIATAIEGMGASLSTGAGNDFASLSVTALKSDVDAALDILADVLLNPSFPEEELATEKQRALTGLQVALSQPAQVASRVFTQTVYGNHPYGRLQTVESVRGITRDDLVNFHRTWYRPGSALVVVAGDVDPTDITRRLNTKLSGWTGAAPAAPEHAAPATPATRQILLVNKAGAVQAAMRIGHPMVDATHPDWPALTVALHILGGGSSGWLFETLREQKGYTYGAYAQGAQRAGPGFFQMTGEVRNAVADSALTLFLELSEQLRAQPVPADDLEAAKSFLAGSFPLTIETPTQIAGQLASARLLGRPLDHVETWRQKLAAVTAADVQRVARTHLHPDRAVVVISGDAAVLKPMLDRFGTVRVVDEHGRPVDGQ